MRLDHLLSRDLGVCGGRGARTGAPPRVLLVARREGPDEQHGSTLPSHPAFCWVGGGCPPFLALVVGGWGHAVGVWGCVPFVSCFCFPLLCCCLLWWWCGGL